MSDYSFQQTIKEIIASLEEAGYDSYAQLTGYLQSGDITYITRRGDARTKILALDHLQLIQYMEQFSSDA